LNNFAGAGVITSASTPFRFDSLQIKSWFNNGNGQVGVVSGTLNGSGVFSQAFTQGSAWQLVDAGGQTVDTLTISVGANGIFLIDDLILSFGPSVAEEFASFAAGLNAISRHVVRHATRVAGVRGQDSIATRNAYSSFARVTDPETGETSVTLSTQDRPQMLGEIYAWVELTGFQVEDNATARDYRGVGLQFGADVPVLPDMVAGLSLGVQDLDALEGGVSQDGVLRFVQPYMAYVAGQWSGEASLIYGWGDFTQTSIGGTGEGETRLWAVSFDGGYDIAMPRGYTLTPMLGLSHGVERVEGISGTLAGAGVDRVRFTQASLGAQVSQATGTGEVYAGLHADWLNTDADSVLVSNLLVDDGWTGRLELGASTEVGLGKTLNASVEVSGLGGDLRGTAGALKFAFRF
jgi:hypothetical protein